VKRRPPVRHRVKAHWRNGVYVHSYVRGSREPEEQPRKPRAKKGLRWRVRLLGDRVRTVTVSAETPARALMEAINVGGVTPHRAEIRRVEAK